MAHHVKKGVSGKVGFQIPRIKFQIKFDMYDPAKYVNEEVLNKRQDGDRHYLGVIGDSAHMVEYIFEKLSGAKIKYIATLGDVKGMERKRKLVCSTTSEFLSKCSCIVTCFEDVDQCKSLFSEASEAGHDTTFVDFSLINVDTAKELAEHAMENGHVFIDCGLTGMQFRTVEERDTIFVGCSQENYHSIKPMLQVLAHRVRWMGDVGSGRAAKSLIDTVQATYATAVSEAIMVADSLGIDAIKMMRNIRITADPDLHRMEDMVADKDFDPKVRKGFRAQSLGEHARSAETVQALADEAGVDSKVLVATSEQLSTAADDHAESDVNAVYLSMGGGKVETARGEGEEDN